MDEPVAGGDEFLAHQVRCSKWPGVGGDIVTLCFCKHCASLIGSGETVNLELLSGVWDGPSPCPRDGVVASAQARDWPHVLQYSCSEACHWSAMCLHLRAPHPAAGPPALRGAFSPGELHLLPRAVGNIGGLSVLP